MGKVLLTNKSQRVYETSNGRFHPGTTEEFDEKEAIELLGYAGEIVKADVGGAKVRKILEAKDKEIAQLKARIEKLETKEPKRPTRRSVN